MVNYIASYYNEDASTVISTLNQYGIDYNNMDQAYKLLENTPYQIITNADGSVRTPIYSYTQPYSSAAEEAASSIDSNVKTATKVKIDIPIETSHLEESKKINFSSGLKNATTGTGSTLKFAVKTVATDIAAVSAGITLGKVIDTALYNANPDFWDSHNMGTLNPDTWNSITTDDNSINARVFNMLLGLNTDDNTSQVYMDENALAYLALYMQEKGLFDSQYKEVENLVNIKNVNNYLNPTIVPDVTLTNGLTSYQWLELDEYKYTYYVYVSDIYNQIWIYSFKDNPKEFNYGDISYNSDGDYLESTNAINAYRSIYYSNDSWHAASGGGLVNKFIGKNKKNVKTDSYLILSLLESSVDGISNQTGASTPNLSDAKTVDDVLKKLKEQYPNLWNNAVSQNVVQPDGTTKQYVYVPVGFPTINANNQVLSGNQTQNDTKINPANAPAELTKSLTDTMTQTLTPNTTPNPPGGDTGSGSTPAVVPPVGQASSLYAIYNPTLEQINSFGGWLWSENFVDQLLKLFNDPMQAIIGLHKVYATPATSGTGDIKVGYLDSGVSSKLVSNQYTTINCGTVSLSEFFGNVFDYSPYTEVQLYLPFIGIVNLDTADVMRSKISVIYHVDVLTGACLAEVKVIRDAAGGTLYQYAGNAAVTLPISSGSYMGIVASLASIAGGVAGTIASGGAAAPMLVGAAGSALNARTKVEHSGSFSGNAGAMGAKIPYLIISRPQSVLADNYQDFIGNPSNKTIALSSCSGYIKVKDVHLENIPATGDELTQIENSLKEGVLL